jgi:hypothetical protein
MKHRRTAASLLLLLAVVGCANTPGRRSGSIAAGNPVATPTPDTATDPYSAPGQPAEGTTDEPAAGSTDGSADASDAPGPGGSGADIPGAGDNGGTQSGAAAEPDASGGPSIGSNPAYGAGAGPEAAVGLIRCGGMYSAETSPYGMMFGYSMPMGTYDHPYSVSLDYGDGATAHARSNDFDQIFRHPYLTPGTFTVTVVISGEGITRQTDSCTFSWFKSAASTETPAPVTSSGGGTA